MALPTLEEYIIMLDNHQLGFNGYSYYNEACKAEELQLRNWLQELRVRRRSCKTYAAAMKKVYPKSDTETMEELIAENEGIKTENDRLKHENAVLRAAISRKSEEDMEYD